MKLFKKKYSRISKVNILYKNNNDNKFNWKDPAYILTILTFISIFLSYKIKYNYIDFFKLPHLFFTYNFLNDSLILLFIPEFYFSLSFGIIFLLIVTRNEFSKKTFLLVSFFYLISLSLFPVIKSYENIVYSIILIGISSCLAIFLYINKETLGLKKSKDKTLLVFLIIFPIFLFTILLTPSFGEISAKTQEYFTLLNTSDDSYIIFGINNGNFVCVTFDRKKKEVYNKIFYFPVTEDRKYNVTRELIGPLTPIVFGTKNTNFITAIRNFINIIYEKFFNFLSLKNDT